VVDAYHAYQHLHTAARALFGDTPAATAWVEQRTAELITTGVAALGGTTHQTVKRMLKRQAPGQAAQQALRPLADSRSGVLRARVASPPAR
jgi:hypothetical protein